MTSTSDPKASFKALKTAMPSYAPSAKTRETFVSILAIISGKAVSSPTSSVVSNDATIWPLSWSIPMWSLRPLPDKALQRNAPKGMICATYRSRLSLRTSHTNLRMH